MVLNSSVPSSVFNIKHNSICYHIVIQAHADETLRVIWIPGEYNLADLLTKTMIAVTMRHRMVESIFYNKVVVIRYNYKS